MLGKSAQIMLISQENDTNYILVFFNALGNLVLPKHREHVHVYAKSLFVYLLCVDWLNTFYIFCLPPSRFSVLVS